MERKCHDLFTAIWVSDYFMECMNRGDEWYLMSEYDCPGLSNAYGENYKNLYKKYVSEGKFIK
jgi:ribonucleotide reductase alpha subunit